MADDAGATRFAARTLHHDQVERTPPQGGARSRARGAPMIRFLSITAAFWIAAVIYLANTGQDDLVWIAWLPGFLIAGCLWILSDQ